MASLLSGIRPYSQSPVQSSGIGTQYKINDPRLFEQTPLGDGLSDALYLYTAPDSRPRREMPSPEEFVGRIHSYEVMSQYVSGRQWRALGLAAEASITMFDMREECTLLKYWAYRILALIRMSHFEQASRELSRLESATRNTELYKGLSRQGRSPTVVWPFELRVIRAMLPAWESKAWSLSLDRLFALVRACKRKADSESSDLDLYKAREFRLTLFIIGILLETGDYSLVEKLLIDQVKCSGNSPHVLSASARMMLQLGNIKEAERLFVQVEKIVPRNDTLSAMNRALYAVAMGRWDTARTQFLSAYDDQPDRIAALNNAAICELYLGNPQAMLNSLQNLMTASPAAAGTSESIVFNYCTGLDLNYDGTNLRDAKSKKMIEVGTWAGDGFSMNSFKV